MVPKFLDFKALSNISELPDPKIYPLSKCGSLRVVSADATVVRMIGPSGEDILIDSRDEIVRAEARLVVYTIRERFTIAEPCGRVWGGSCVMWVRHRIVLTCLSVCDYSLELVPFRRISLHRSTHLLAMGMRHSG